MRDDPGFEARFTAAYRRYLDDAPEIDAVALARSVARTHPQRRSWLAWPSALPQARGAWVVLAAALLLLGMLAATLSFGALRHLPGPVGLVHSGLIAFGTSDGHVLLQEPDWSSARDISAPTGGDHLPVWSPDGTRLAFWRVTGDWFSIVVTDQDGVVQSSTLTGAPVPEEVSYAGGAPGPIAWSPDSRRLALWMWLDGIPRIHTMSSDGSDLRVIGDRRIPAIDPAWSPDGTRIAFAGMGDFFGDSAPDSTGLFVMDADGTHVTRIASVDHPIGDSDFYAFHEPQWQPGGELIAFQADPDGPMHVFVVRSDGTGLRDISTEVGGTATDDAWPAWSPDGTRLAFTRARPEVVGYQVVVVDADGTGAVMPEHPPVQGATITWAPDGTRILAYSPSQTDIVDIDLTGQRPARSLPVLFDEEGHWQRLAP